MGESIDKRKFDRVKTHIPVRFRTLRGDAGGTGSSSLTKNLSEGGIRFRTSDFISMACRLIVELDIPMFTKPVKAISKVAWIKKSPSGNDYEIGNQFLEMNKQDKELISEYVDSLNLYNDSEEETNVASTESAEMETEITREEA